MADAARSRPSPSAPPSRRSRSASASARRSRAIRALDLAGGRLLSRVLSKHDIEFAPKAVALLVVAWTFPAIVARVMPEPRPGVAEPGWRRACAPTGAPFFVVVLYKNVLFFLVPIWFGAAHFPSLNMGAPLLLAAMALATCFASWWQQRGHRAPGAPRDLVGRRALRGARAGDGRARVHFAARVAVPRGAAVDGRGDGGAQRRREHPQPPRARRLLAGAMPVAVLVVLAAPLLPPVPADCLDKGAGTAIVEPQPRGPRRFVPPRHPPRLRLVRRVAARALPAAGDLQVVPRRGRRRRPVVDEHRGRPRRRLPHGHLQGLRPRPAAGAPTCSTRRAS